MAAYPTAYLAEVVENQGKLFDAFACNHPDSDTEVFIAAYMASSTRRSVDQAQAYVCTMDAHDLWNYFVRVDGYEPVTGVGLTGFMPDWIGEFYAYYQWYYDIPSAQVVNDVPVGFLEKAYHGLHDLDLELAVKKVSPLPRTVPKG